MSEASMTLQSSDKIRDQAGDQEAKWIVVQKKTFTKWVNMHLRKRGCKIDNIETGFSSGMNLMQLMAQLYDLTIPRYNKNPKMRAHQVDNVHIALKMVELAGIKLHNIKVLNFIESDMKLILGSVWSIIHAYSIQGISIDEMNAREGLLLWCQRKTKNHKDVDIKNFGTSWKSGLGFCALIHAHRPDLIDYDSLDKANDTTNLQLAFDVAEEKLGICKFLDVEDITETALPDEKSVMTYVSEMFHYFSSLGDSEVAGRRIEKFIQFSQDKQALIDDYVAKNSNLIEWVKAKKSELESRPENVPDNTDVPAAKMLLAQYWRYKAVEKPERSIEKFDVDNVYAALQTKLRVFGRSPYVPPEGQGSSDLSEAWTQLEDAEAGRLSALQAHLIEVKENLRLKYASAANSFVEYMAQQEKAINNVSGELSDQLVALTSFKEDITFQGQKQLQNVAEINNEVLEAGIKDNKHTNITLEEVGLIWEELNTILNNKRQHVENMLARKADKDRIRAEQEAIERAREALRTAFASKANALAPWISHEKETLDSPASDLEAERSAVQSVLDKQAEGDSLVQECVVLDDRLVAEGVRDNKYTEYTVGELQLLWDEVMNSAVNKRTLIDNKIARRNERERISAEAATIEAANENLRVLFADKASAMDSTIKNIQGVISNTDGDIDQQLQNILNAQDDIKASSQPLTELAGIHQRVQDAGIVDNPHTTLSFEELNAAHVELGKRADSRSRFLEAQIALKNQTSDVPEATLNEYREVFKAFDKDHSNALNKSEFKACVASLGQALQDQEIDVLIQAVDKTGDGLVNMDEFVAYMIERTQDKDTPDQIKKAFSILSQGKDTITHDMLSVSIDPHKATWFVENGDKTDVPGEVNFVTYTDRSYE